VKLIDANGGILGDFSLSNGKGQFYGFIGENIARVYIGSRRYIMTELMYSTPKAAGKFTPAPKAASQAKAAPVPAPGPCSVRFHPCANYVGEDRMYLPAVPTMSGKFVSDATELRNKRRCFSYGYELWHACGGRGSTVTVNYQLKSVCGAACILARKSGDSKQTGKYSSKIDSFSFGGEQACYVDVHDCPKDSSQVVGRELVPVLDASMDSKMAVQMHKSHCFAYAYTQWAKCGMLSHVKAVYSDTGGQSSEYLFGPPQLCYIEFDHCDARKENFYHQQVPRDFRAQVSLAHCMHSAKEGWERCRRCEGGYCKVS
jgi:hypothetical protein